MKSFFFLLLLCPTAVFAQDRFILTPNGFDPVYIQRPAKSDEKLIEAAKNWNDFYNKQEHDNYDVTTTSLRIDAWRDNGFYYRNLGETYSYNIKYSLLVTLNGDSLTVQFVVKEIYAKKTLLKMTTSDWYTPDGTIKDDMDLAKQSLEKTANNILDSFEKFIQN